MSAHPVTRQEFGIRTWTQDSSQTRSRFCEVLIKHPCVFVCLEVVRLLLIAQPSLAGSLVFSSREIFHETYTLEGSDPEKESVLIAISLMNAITYIHAQSLLVCFALLGR